MVTERRYDIDWLRVIAICLLLIYHIAIIFQPWAMMLGFIRSEELMENLWKPMTMLNVWRIPFLFYVSGMGVYFAIGKRNWQQLLMERTKRILVPFIFGALALTPLHFSMFQKYYSIPASYYPHAGHLWFLANIFVYVLLLSPLFFYLKKNGSGRFMQWLSAYMKYPLAPLSISAFFVIEVLLVKPQIFELYANTWHGFFLGLLAFFFGFLYVYCGKTFWTTILKWRWLYLFVAACLYTIRLVVFELRVPNYFLAIESNTWILAIFGFGYRYLNRPSVVLSYLSQAAYPVYIIHMLMLYAGATLILPLQIPVALKFLFIVTFTGISCFVFYEFTIRRIKVLRPLFGMKLHRKAKETEANKTLYVQ